jgi:hypothetical protein
MQMIAVRFAVTLAPIWKARYARIAHRRSLLEVSLADMRQLHAILP